MARLMSCSKNQFFQSLRSERALVVIGETGSGKTTLVPQYASQVLEGLIVCTQIRSATVIGVAQCIASEMDGMAPGRSVGYEVGSASTSGQKILIVTETSLIERAQRDPLLTQIVALVIDDAHERTLTTDIVIGIAKRVLFQRPDFRLVLLLAPVDPQPFLNFLTRPPCMEMSTATVGVRLSTMRVKGGTSFPVTVEERLVTEDIEDVCREVVRALAARRSGHCLVFVASEHHVWRCIRHLNKMVEPHWKILPFCDNLMVQELNRVLNFDDKQGALQLVAFCAGAIAETRTVAGVRLVIDTGLVEERRYDADRNITILEQVRISKATAEQRCLLAGRSATGHCIRLYSWNRLDRSDDEPEVRRSSLELTILQICSLHCDPFFFDFVDEPEGPRLRRSTAWLKRHGLITETRFRPTERGRALVRLPFDAATGHFVLASQERYRHGTAALAVAILLNTTDSIFVSDGHEGRLAPVRATSSDLEHFLDVLKAWMSAGIDSECGHSDREPVAGCPSCRAEYAAGQCLNQPILERLRLTTVSLRPLLGSGPATRAEMPCAEALGRCLAEAFPERIAEFVLPSNPAAGVHFLTSGLGGQLAATSVLTAGTNFFVALSLKRMLSGRLVADLAHPVEWDWIPADVRSSIQGSKLDVTACYVQSNVHSRYADHCFRRLQESDRKFPFTIPAYDVANATMTVYSPKAHAVRVAEICCAEVDALRRQDLEEETTTVDCWKGNLEMTVSAGLGFRNLEEIGEARRVCFTDPPVSSEAEFLKWVCRIARTTPPNVKWWQYRSIYGAAGDDPCPVPEGIVVFHQKEAALLARSNCPETVATRMDHQDAHGTVRVTTDVENLCEVLVHHQFKPLNVRQWRPKTHRCQIQILNVPPKVTETKLKAIVRPPPTTMTIVASTRWSACYDATLDYTDRSSCEEALKWIQCSPLLTRPYTVAQPSGEPLQVRVEFVKTVQTEPAEYLVTFDTPDKADGLYATRRSFVELIVDGFSTVTVKHPELYGLDRHARAIAAFHGVGFCSTMKPDGTCQMTFRDGAPSSCAKAAEAFRKISEPIWYVFHDREKQAMGLELLTSGTLRKWADQLNLLVEECHAGNRFVGIAIYGEQIQQGRFMAQLADYYAEFTSRYLMVSLSPSAGGLFLPGCSGDVLLKRLDDGSGQWRISFDASTNAIEIFVTAGVPAPSRVVDWCRTTLDSILQSCSQSSATAVRCVYCRQHAGAPFSICGHHHCRECLERSVKSLVAPFSDRRLTRPEAQRLVDGDAATVRCPSCRIAVSAKDVVAGLQKSTLDQVCTALALLHISATDHPISPCPAPSCHGLVQRKDGYAKCPSCQKSVCPLCAVVDDDRHRSVTCKEYQEILEGRFAFDIAGLAARAEKYARDHWAQFCSGSGPIQSVAINPGLELGCMAMQRYCRAIEVLGLKDLERNTIFAWHGTPETALPMICSEGFDPKRRSGQAHGPGEYFGINAATSMGYNRASNHLIIAELLRCPQLHTHGTFCYVVENPVDWSYAFNLPVLVVTYGSSYVPKPIPWIISEKRPLPKLFGPKGKTGLMASRYIQN